MNETDDQKLNRAFREGKDAYIKDSKNGYRENPYEFSGDDDLDQKMHEEFERGFNEARDTDQK